MEQNRLAIEAALEQSQQEKRELGESLKSAVSDYPGCVKAQMDKLDKPKDSAQFSAIGKLMWQKIRSAIDHAGGSDRFPPMGIGMFDEDLFNTIKRTGTNVTIDDSWAHTRSISFCISELTIGRNLHTGKYHAAELLDWVEREFDATYRCKT